MWLTDGFWVTFFWKVEGSSAHTRESRAAHVWQLMCTVITTIWWRGALTCGSHARQFNVHGNYYYMVEGSPHVCSN